MKINLNEGFRRIVLLLSISISLTILIFAVPKIFEKNTAYWNSKSALMDDHFIPTQELERKLDLKPWEMYDLQSRKTAVLFEGIDTIRKLNFAFIFDSTKQLNEQDIEDIIKGGKYVDIAQNTDFEIMTKEEKKEILFKKAWSIQNSDTKIKFKSIEKEYRELIMFFIALTLIGAILPWIIFHVVKFIISGFSYPKK